MRGPFSTEHRSRVTVMYNTSAKNTVDCRFSSWMLLHLIRQETTLVTPDPKPRHLTLVLLLAAIGIPLATAIRYGKEAMARPKLYLALWLIYEALLAIITFFMKVIEKVHEKWVDLAANWLYSLSALLLSNYRRRYLRHVASAHQALDLKGIKTSTAYSFDVSEVYIEPRLFLRSAKMKLVNPIDASAATGKAGIIWDYLDRQPPTNRGWIFIRAAGVGKTTLLKYTALELATKRKRRVPIFLLLRQQADSIRAAPNISLAELARKDLTDSGCPPPPGWLERELSGHKCVVMLDGLDEVADPETRRIVVEWIERQMTMYAQNWFLITTREHGYREEQLSRVTQLVIGQFSWGQVEEFIRKWYLAHQRKGVELGNFDRNASDVQLAEQEADDLIRRLGSSAALSRLCVNPLLLTMAATVHHSQSSLPEHRAELYAAICDVFLGNRQLAKKLSIPLTPAKTKRVLEPLAYNMMKSQCQEISRTQATKVISATLKAVSPDSSPDDFITMVENSGGLLLESGTGLYSFAHLTFQEYLAACHVHTQRLEDELLMHLNESWWWETLRLYGAQGDSSPILEACLKEKPPKANLLILALDCLEESREIRFELRKELERTLASVADDPATYDPEILLALRVRRLKPIGQNQYVDMSRITNSEYSLFLQNVHERREPDQWGVHEVKVGSDPVVGTRPSDANAFCAWMTARDTGEWYYRIPTVVETQGDKALHRANDIGSYWVQSGSVVVCSAAASSSPLENICHAIEREARLALRCDLKFASKIIDSLSRDAVNQHSLKALDEIRANVDRVMVLIDQGIRANDASRYLDAAENLSADLIARESERHNTDLVVSLRKLPGVLARDARLISVMDIILTNYCSERSLDLDHTLTLLDQMDDAPMEFRNHAWDSKAIVQRLCDRDNRGSSKYQDYASRIIEEFRDFVLYFIDLEVAPRQQDNAVTVVCSSACAALLLLAAAGQNLELRNPRGKVRFKVPASPFVQACLEIAVDLVKLEGRLQGSMRAFEGIRIVKVRRD
jgi:hypothetical protein